jgi:hypothetical protein
MERQLNHSPKPGAPTAHKTNRPRTAHLGAGVGGPGAQVPRRGRGDLRHAPEGAVYGVVGDGQGIYGLVELDHERVGPELERGGSDRRRGALALLGLDDGEPGVGAAGGAVGAAGAAGAAGVLDQRAVPGDNQLAVPGAGAGRGAGGEGGRAVGAAGGRRAVAVAAAATAAAAAAARVAAAEVGHWPGVEVGVAHRPGVDLAALGGRGLRGGGGGGRVVSGRRGREWRRWRLRRTVTRRASAHAIAADKAGRLRVIAGAAASGRKREDSRRI